MIIDKSLVDTTMCYSTGHDTTMRLYRELHRALKPGGRLITISLHRADEVLPYGTNNPGCRFASSSCVLAGTRERGACHSLCVFDKLDGCDARTARVISSFHPIEFVGALGPVEGRWDDDDEGNYEYDRETNDHTADELLALFNQALEII